MSDHIPQALLIEILSRLTLKELVRSIIVCKSWYSLITSPHFISFHANQLSPPPNTDLLLIRHVTDNRYALDNEQYSIHFHNDKHHTFPLHKTFDFPFKSYNSHFRLVGCSNGVICLSDDLIAINHVIILWNPTIRKSVTLPRPNFTYHSHGPFDQLIGSEFNSVTNDYKVVRVVYVGYDYWSPLVEVYDLSVGSWRTVDPKGFCYFIDKHASQVFLNGGVHWVGSKFRGDGAVHNVIVSFDLRNDVFGLTKFPDSVADEGFRGGFSVSAVGESLALLQRFSSGNVVTCCNVWVMKQYGVTDSWTKLFSIDDLTGGLLKVCGFLKNEEPLAIVEQRGDPYLNDRVKSLVSYNSKSKQKNFIGRIRNTESLFVDYFVESLALLGVKGESVERVRQCRKQKRARSKIE